MEKVSFKTAKAIKEVGYPLERFQTVSREQFESGHGYKYSTDKNFYSESPSILHPEDNDTIDMYYCSTYLEVWLWLCREKKMLLSIQEFCGEWNVYSPQAHGHIAEHFTDPEKAIIAAIEYLVENNLIK